MVACLMRLSPLPGRTRAEEGRTSLAPLRLYKETCAGSCLRSVCCRPQLRRRSNTRKKSNYPSTTVDFGSALPPSLFLQCVICHRGAIISGGKARSTRRRPFPSFLLVPRLPNPNSIAGQLTIGVATFFRPLGHSDFGRNANVVLVLPECTADDAAPFSSRQGSLKMYLLAEAETEKGSAIFCLRSTSS